MTAATMQKETNPGPSADQQFVGPYRLDKTLGKGQTGESLPCTVVTDTSQSIHQQHSPCCVQLHTLSFHSKKFGKIKSQNRTILVFQSRKAIRTSEAKEGSKFWLGLGHQSHWTLLLSAASSGWVDVYDALASVLITNNTCSKAPQWCWRSWSYNMVTTYPVQVYIQIA